MDKWFQLASDRDGGAYPSRLSPDAVWLLVWLAVAFCAVHALRRLRVHPAAKPPARYNLNQRLYHWCNFLLLALVALSGYWLFFRHAPNVPLLASLTWLDVHIYSGLLFAAGVVFHAIAATTRGEWRSMWPERNDLREAAIIWRNFLGRTRDYPPMRKYDALQKIYHHVLSLLAIAFIFSGVVMWLSAERLRLSARSVLHALRLAHDVSAVLLIVMVIGHVYFSLLKVNRQNLKDMALGVESERGSEAAD